MTGHHLGYNLTPVNGKKAGISTLQISFLQKNKKLICKVLISLHTPFEGCICTTPRSQHFSDFGRKKLTPVNWKVSRDFVQ